MGEALEKLGFEVTIKTDLATKRDMDDAIREFHKKADDSDVALFYYSGHGAQIDGQNYLIPTQEDIITSTDVQYNAVNLSFAISTIEEAKTPINIFILDACRDDFSTGNKSLFNKGFASVKASKGTLIAYATAPDKAAQSTRGHNSIYTKYLLEEIHTPNISITKTLNRVGTKVSDATNGGQIPWTNSCLYKDFIFNYIYYNE